jgi:hypothetical protein
MKTKLFWTEPQRTLGGIDIPRRRFEIVAASLSILPTFVRVKTADGKHLHVCANEIERASD